MSLSSKRTYDLSPKRRELLEALLKQEGVGPASTQRITPRDKAAPVRLSFAQERLWFLEQLTPGHPVYIVPTAVRLSGPVHVSALQRGLNEIIRRHEALRTTFTAVDGQPVGIVAPTLTLTLRVVDLRDLPEPDWENEALRRINEEARRPFDLEKGPLLRAALWRLGEEEHLFLLTMHHIITEGWSIALLFRELEAFYEAFSSGKPAPPLPHLPIQYADYARWERERLNGEVLQTQLAYWKKQLGGPIPTLQLPTDRPRPAVQNQSGAIQSLKLPQRLSEGLMDLSNREGVTLFMTLLAGYITLIFRYTSQEDILVGSPISNRNRVELEGLIGFFVNTLVLRTDLSGNPSVRELLRRVREVALGALAHQEMPFEHLVDILQPDRGMSHHPLFQVMFALQNTPMLDLKLKGLMPGQILSHDQIHTGTSKIDLSMVIEESARGLTVWLEYNTDLFEEATIGRMLGHYQTLLEAIFENPEQRISDLSFLTKAERHKLHVDWNDTQADYPRDSCTHQLFEAQVERTPDAVVVVFEEEQLTYRELNRRANQVAHHLRGLGVGPEVLVGICIDRSLEMVVGLLGILKAGGAYVPLDPAYPKERLAFMLEDVQAPVLLTQQQLVEGLPEHRAKVVCLDSGWEAIAGESEENPASGVTADNLAYVIYTSGSTGRPKGVEIQHAGLVNLVTWHRRVYGVTPADRATQLAALAFDASVWELWPYLAAGASIHIPEEETRVLPSKLLEWLAAEAITICFLLTPLAEAVLEEQWPTGLAMRALLTGGDKLRRAPRKALPFGLFNHYGPTENTVVATWTPVAAGTETDAPPPIGRPIANTQVYVLDQNLQPVPIGVPGELYIGGDGLARGYLKQPELTAEKFIPNTFSDEPGARLYKTGDLVRYLPDANIEFLGRIDHQVKIRGFRIEPGETEAVLGQYPAVRETVVLAREDVPGEKRLVAYLVPNQAPVLSISELRSFLKKKLPEYMVPSSFIVLDALPLTPNGKVDRRALPTPDRARPELERASVNPRTPMESLIAEIWQDLLGVDRVSVYDNFFDLGGHSLLSLRVVARLEKAIGLRINPGELIFQTLGQLASVCEQQIHIRQKSAPMSFAQRLFDPFKRAIFHMIGDRK